MKEKSLSLYSSEMVSLNNQKGKQAEEIEMNNRSIGSYKKDLRTAEKDVFNIKKIFSVQKSASLQD